MPPARFRSAGTWAAVGPGMALAAFILAYPLWQAARLSVSDVSRFGKVRGFAGLDNFEFVLSDPDFLGSAWRTVVWTVGVVGGTILVSIPTAMILARDFYGRALARLIVMLPWAVSLTMMAVIWRWALHGELGLLNATLRDICVLEENVVWLADAGTAFAAQMFIGVLVSVPFTVTVLLGGLASIPDDMHEAASIEGAGPLARHRTITLPLLRPFVNIAVVLNMIYVFNSFPIIWVTTQGGPGGGTDILVTYLYKLAFRYGRMGDAAVVSLLMFAVILGCAILYLCLARERDE